ncbi:DapH/DapD/GlmU-related protein [Fundicoccus culcitae]|uniref:Sugar O-acetyltransferase n=1 Tax=Fundicoccus culcitae TaxID=2969821 RepID=A0ABY5P905_9LACT|nr:DapH/DapD/GlmU-related protein [Fundicoccus culcitae]UUX35071.1 sugar O-acetyltransferase [Fundicoccus culcitae]
MLEELLEHLNAGKALIAGNEFEATMQSVSIQTQERLAEMNNSYHTDEEMRAKVERILGYSIPESTRIRQPFYMDFGKNIQFGENVFINASVHMQDQGGIKIGNNALIGHQVVLATLDHDLEPSKRGNLHPAPIVIEEDVWIGANATILKGVTIGKGSVVAAGCVVNKDVPPYSVVGGIPARVIKNLTVEEK